MLLLRYNPGFILSGQECDRAQGNRGDLTKELLGVRGLCRVRGVILALVEW